MPGGRERTGRLVAIDLDGTSIAHAHAFIAAERAVAIDDILAGNSFRPVGRGAGPFRLRLSVRDNRLVLAVADQAGAPVVTHVLALAPFARVVKDYFLICESYYEAIRSAGSERIEAIDMGRRGIHDEAAAIVRERLAGKVEIDFDTARRLFTLIAALSWTGRET